MIIPSQQYKDYEMACGDFLPFLEKTINYPVNVKCIFYMPSKRRVDKSNLEAAIHDILVKWEVLEDDNRNIIASTDGSRVLYDKENPRTEIEITPFTEEYEMWISHKKKDERDE